MSINTDSKKLEVRIDTHKQLSTYEINDWILSCVQPHKNEKLLDIGCGTGKQIKSFSNHCGTFPKIIAIDASADSLKTVEKICLDKKIQNLKTVRGNMDELPDLLGLRNKFDLIISCFALYYSQNIPKIITTIKQLLENQGRFFVCGPVPGNNAELIEFHSQISKSQTNSDDFPMISSILPEIKKKFSKIEQYNFSNPLHFPNPNSLIDYWKSYHLYDPSLEDKFIINTKNYFEKHAEFISTKKVLGIIARM